MRPDSRRTMRRRVCGGIGAAVLALAMPLSFADTLTRPATGVTRIHFKLPGELLVRAGSEEKLTVEAEAKVLPRIDIAIAGETLTLSSKQGFKTDKPLRITLTLKALRSLRSEGSGNAMVEHFGGTDIEIDARGSGNIRLHDVRPARLAIRIDGSGNVEATGSGKAVTARIDGTGTIDAAGFVAQSAQVRIEGSGTIRVHADDTLHAEIGGAGNIEYKGKAKVTQSITGAGSVDRI